MERKHLPIVVEEVFNTSITDLWEAITNAERMRQWFFSNIELFKTQVGFQTQFEVKSDDKIFLHLWKVTDVKPLQKITVNWKYGGYSGDSSVTMELFKIEKQSKIRVTCIGIETFPDSVVEFTRESCTGGWRYFIQDRLKQYIEHK